LIIDSRSFIDIGYGFIWLTQKDDELNNKNQKRQTTFVIGATLRTYWVPQLYYADVHFFDR
jgi:hypothetical protein